MTYRREHKTDDSTMSPHLSDPNQSRNESHTGGSSSNEVEDKNDIGSTLHSMYAVLNGRWPAQICKLDARLELFLNDCSQVEVKERSCIGAGGNVFGGFCIMISESVLLV